MILLKVVLEGNGMMFDNMMIIYFFEMGVGYYGFDIEVLMVVMIGVNLRFDIVGWYICFFFYGIEGYKMFSNWYIMLFNGYGNLIEYYGDFDIEMLCCGFW